MPIAIGRAYEPVEVDLWGELYKTKPVTRSVEKALAKVNEKLDQATTSDQNVKYLAELIALRLENPNGVVALIEKKWKEDDLSVEQLTAFIENVAEADRPT